MNVMPAQAFRIEKAVTERKKQQQQKAGAVFAEFVQAYLQCPPPLREAPVSHDPTGGRFGQSDGENNLAPRHGL